jgi:hypothetical protein
MNGINQMIAQGIQPPKFESPLNQFVQVETIRQAQQTNALRQAQMQEIERERLSKNVLNKAYADAFDPTKGTFDQSKLIQNLATSGQGGLVPGVLEGLRKARKAEVDIEKVGSEIETARFNLFEKRMKFYAKEATELKSPLEGQEWYKQLYADPVVKRTYDQRGITLDQLIAQVPTDPAQFEQWKQRTALGADEFIKQNKPQFMQQDTGGATRVLAVPGLGGPATAVGGTERAKTMTPDAAAREKRERDLALAENMAAAKARGKKLAENKVEAERALPGAIATAEQTLTLIDEMIGDARVSKDGKKWEVPKGGRDPAEGFTDYVGLGFPGERFLEGSDAASYERRQLQIEGKTFLEAFESLRGGGAITEVEGAKGQQAISRMNKAQSEVEYVKAARELQEVVRKGVDRARAKAGAGGAAAPATPGAPAAGAMNPATMSDDELRRALGL